MGELVDLLTEAFGAVPAVPAEGRLSDSISATAYWSFQPSLEVVVAESARTPATGRRSPRGEAASRGARSRSLY